MLSIIILNWNQYEDTSECLNSLGNNYKIMLVDNGSIDGSADKLKAQYPHIELIKNKTNLGFAAGNNVAIKKALQDGNNYILLLNNDTKVEPDFLEWLVKAMKRSEDIGIVSPKIMCFDKPQKVWFSGGYYLPILKKPTHAFDKQGEIDWASGCCMLVRKEVFNKIGLLDEDYFNNYEDVDFCYRAKKAGFNIKLVPESIIYHKFAASMGGKFSPFYTYYRTRNNLLFFKKTKQWLPLVLNFLTFPVYSIISSIKNGQIEGVKTTLLAVFDFLRGKVGKSYV